jgi:hypothetical protein
MAEEKFLDLIHIVYVSAAEGEFKQSDLLELLKVARSKNAKIDVTGRLLFYKGSFFQVLEGPAPAVEQIYEKISRDSRHGKILKIIQEPIERRTFQAWTMGFADMNVKDLKSIPGLNDFFSRGSCFYDLEENMAKKILKAFREGKWRQLIGDEAA